MSETVETIRIVIIALAGVLLVIAALIGLVRLSRGPTTLDRAVSTDLLLGIVLAGLAIEAVVNRHTTSLPVMLVLALLSFAGPVAIARFIADPPKGRTGPDPDSDDDDTDSDSIAQDRAADADQAEVDRAEAEAVEAEPTESEAVESEAVESGSVEAEQGDPAEPAADRSPLAERGDR